MKLPETQAITKAAEQHTNKAQNALEFVSEHGLIESLEDYRAAPRYIAELKEKREELENKRREWTDPLNAVIKSITAAFKPATEFYDQAEALLKDRLAAFYHNQNDRRNKLLSSVASEKDAAKRDIIMDEAAWAEVPKLKGVSLRVSWTGRVLDEATLKQDLIEHARWELLTPNVKALEALTKAQKGDPFIPGWMAFQKTVVAISKSLVE